MYLHFVFALALSSPLAATPAVPPSVAHPHAPGGADERQVASPTPPRHEPAPLTIDRAVAIALDRNPSIRAAEFGIVAARETTGAARAAYYPDVSATAGYSRWERHAFLPDGIDGSAVASTIGPTNDWFAGLTGRVLLFDSGARAAGVRAALAGEHLADAEAAQLRQDLALKVHEAYYGVAAALRALEVARQEAGRSEDHLRLAEERKAAGAVAGADVLRARVGVSEAGLHVVSAEHLVRVAAGRLNTAMGLPPETIVQLAAEDPGAVAPIALDYTAAAARALDQRPSLAAGRSRIDVSQAALDKARSQFGPRLSADWRAGFRDAEWWPRDRDWSVGFSVEIPLFDGGARARARGRATAELSRAESGHAADALQVRRDVWDARSNVDKSVEALRTTEALVAEAEDSLRVSRDRYRVGAGTLNELLDAEAALARAASVAVQAMLDYRTARAAFDWSVGALAQP